MREFLFILLTLAIVCGAGWAAWERMAAQDRTIKELRARVESGDRLAQSSENATTKVIERQIVVRQEADRAKTEIAQAVGAGAMVPAPVWGVARVAIERMRQQANSGPANLNPGVAS